MTEPVVPPVPLTAAAVKLLLHHRYPVDKGWLYLSEIELLTPTEAGQPPKSRRIDGLAVGMYGSNCHEIQGFEIKVARSDLLAELKDPAKTHANMQVCNRWWLVCPPGIAKDEEVPSTWGIIHVQGPDQLRLKRQAPQLSPNTRDETFWSGLLRKVAFRSAGKDELEEAERRGRRLAEAEYKRRNGPPTTFEVSRKLEELKALNEQVKAFEVASGIRISEYRGGKELGDIVNALHHHDPAALSQNMTYPIMNLDRVLTELREIQARLGQWKNDAA